MPERGCACVETGGVFVVSSQKARAIGDVRNCIPLAAHKFLALSSIPSMAAAVVIPTYMQLADAVALLRLPQAVTDMAARR
jgi:hypothetical protein